MKYGASSSLKQKFTGHERDAESGLDFAQARYCSSVTGRFMSVDPISGKESVPQSWNRYIYALNNPLFFIDPDGLEWRQNNETGIVKWYNQDDDRNGTTLWTRLVYSIGEGENAYDIHLNPNGPQGRRVHFEFDPFSPQTLGITFVPNSDYDAIGWYATPGRGNPMRDAIQDDPMAIITAVGLGYGAVQGTIALLGKNVPSPTGNLMRVAEEGKPAFQLNKGEEGISVFDPRGVSPPLTDKEVLSNFRSGSVIKELSPAQVEAQGLKVTPTPGADVLPKRLQIAHREIRPGEGMNRNSFKKALKNLD
jgi:RHS repeat-associated protein